MSWILLVLMSAAIAGLVGISDKTAMYKYAKYPLTLPLLIGMAQSTVGIVIISVFGIPDEATFEVNGFFSLRKFLGLFLSNRLRQFLQR